MTNAVESNNSRLRLRVRAPAWTEMACFAAVTWKQTVATRTEFRDRVRRAVGLICRATS
jgi:hypothetical protein